MNDLRERNVGEFNRDVEKLDGYVYSTSERLSCRLSNARMSQAILGYARPEGRRVLDVGCGDGIYSLELVRAGASEVRGVDAAEQAVASARRRAEGLEHVSFETVDIYSLPEPDEPYDVAVVRGMLHHLYDAPRAIERICRVAREIVVCEPNGYNPVLKVIEKLSPYHVEHEEKSYPPSQLDRWFEGCGGRVIRSGYIGLVPMFCPDAFARAMKALEPWVEAVPLLRAVGCGQYMQLIRVEH